MALRVQDQSPAVQAMAENWPIAEALMGGTRAMRAAGETFLPKWPNEDPQSYAARLKTATLFPAFKRTVGVMAGKPFSKALTLGDDTPPRIAEFCENVDLEGRNLHAFASDLMIECLGFGLAGVLVDYPTTEGQVRTLADEQRIGARPYFVFVKHGQILGWKAQKVAGVLTLTELRLAETKEEDDGAYGTVCVNRVRVLRPGMWEVWQEQDNGEYSLIEGGTTTLDKIPFVPFYGWRLAFMEGVSPLLDLAHLNVKHWQSQSDQDTILHVARVPVLAVSGVDDDKWQLTVGASAAVKLPQGGDMKYVEHTGAAIEAGQKALEALEEQMIQTGAELLVKKPGDRSATESANDAEANKCDLQRVVETFEDGLDQSLQFMADWIGEPEGGHASLFKDFGAATLSDASAQLILAMQQAGLISKKTAILEQQRRGTLAADIDPDTEIEDAEADGPPLGTMNNDPAGGNGGNGE